MDLNEITARFKKYGAFGQLISFGFFCIIFGISYPVITDPALLVIIVSISAVMFFFLYLFYIYWINHGIIKFIDKINDKDSLAALAGNLNQTANKTFYLQIIALSCVYIPVLMIMYFYLGYQNIYYHFYIIFISFFIILYAGYYTRGIWYTKIYPLGRLNIPVPVQRLRSKIISLIIPTILLVNVIISVIVYLFYGNIIKSEIDQKVSLIIDNETNLLERLDDYSGFSVSKFCAAKSGAAFITDMNGEIYFSYPDKGDAGKNLIDIIEKNESTSYPYGPAVESLKSVNKNSYAKFDGIYSSAHSVFFSKRIGSGNRNLIYIFREENIYDSVYFSIFMFTLILFILNFFIWFAVNRKLHLVSQSMDAVMPVITAASRGDLTQPISIIKTRDVLEDFTRVCSAHFNNIREFMIMGKDLSDNLRFLSDHIS
ncbi:MAG: hypothetical protein MUC95_11035, partial [Spirochaetes bacterium]|nr:hypothetical protein [Spirochaetota bacterium]